MDFTYWFSEIGISFIPFIYFVFLILHFFFFGGGGVWRGRIAFPVFPNFGCISIMTMERRKDSFRHPVVSIYIADFLSFEHDWLDIT